MNTDHPHRTQERHTSEGADRLFEETSFESAAATTAKQRTVPYYAGTLAGIAMATIATLAIESSDGVRRLVEQAFVHHWIAKSVLTIGAFAVVYHITGERPMNHRRWCTIIVTAVLLGSVAMGGVFVLLLF